LAMARCTSRSVTATSSQIADANRRPPCCQAASPSQSAETKMRDAEPSRLKKGCDNPRMIWRGYGTVRTSCKSLSLDGKWKCSPACAPARHRAKCPCNPLQPQCDFNNMRRQLRIQSRDKVSARVGQLGGMPRRRRKGASLRARRRLQQRARTTTDARASLERQIVGLHGALKRCIRVALQVKNTKSLGARRHRRPRRRRSNSPPARRHSPAPAGSCDAPERSIIVRKRCLCGHRG